MSHHQDDRLLARTGSVFLENGKRIHPTQKPLDLFTELVGVHSRPGDLVVDPFLGSGTTAVAAVESERKFYGGDIDHHYVQEARRRVQG